MVCFFRKRHFPNPSDIWTGSTAVEIWTTIYPPSLSLLISSAKNWLFGNTWSSTEKMIFLIFEMFVFYINIWYLNIPTESPKVSFSFQSDGTLLQRLVINSGDASCVIVMPHVWDLSVVSIVMPHVWDLSVVSRASASFLHLRWPKGHAIPPPHNMALGLDNCQCSRFQNWFFIFDLISM